MLDHLAYYMTDTWTFFIMLAWPFAGNVSGESRNCYGREKFQNDGTETNKNKTAKGFSILVCITFVWLYLQFCNHSLLKIKIK